VNKIRNVALLLAVVLATIGAAAQPGNTEKATDETARESAGDDRLDAIPRGPFPLGERASFNDPVADALVAEALEKNPDVVQARALVGAAQSRVRPARSLPDPFLGTTYQVEGTSFGLGSMPDTFLGFMFSQPLPWPGKRELAGGTAESEAKEIEAGAVGRTALSLEARVRRAYYDLLLARAQLGLIEDRRQAWEQIEGVVRERYAVGVGVLQDLLRTQVEILRLDEARAVEQAIVTSRVAELNRLIGRQQETAIESPQVLEYRASPVGFEAIFPAVRQRSPELAASRQSVETSHLRIAVAKKNFRPDFVVSGGPMIRGSLDPMWQLGFGISLPIYAKSKQQGRLREAEWILESNEAGTRSIELELELRTRERLASLDASQKIAKLYLEGVLPLDQLSLEAAIASYRTGKIPFVTVLEALNALYADRSVFLDRLAESEKWRVTIDEADLQASGGMTSGTSPTGMGAAISTSGMNASTAMSSSGGQDSGMGSGQMK